MTDIAADEMVRPRQIWEALGVSRSVVYRLIESGELPSVRIGRCRRVPASAVLAYLNKHASLSTRTAEAS